MQKGWSNVPKSCKWEGTLYSTKNPNLLAYPKLERSVNVRHPWVGLSRHHGIVRHCFQPNTVSFPKSSQKLAATRGTFWGTFLACYNTVEPLRVIFMLAWVFPFSLFCFPMSRKCCLFHTPPTPLPPFFFVNIEVTLKAFPKNGFRIEAHFSRREQKSIK